MTPRERFLSLLKHDILKLDLAELNFGVYRILNARRDLVLRFLDEELPAFIADQLATLPGTATEDEEGRIYAALDTFFHRYWDDGDFVLRPRRGRDAAYSIPYDGSDVHFHWATKGSHYVKSGEFLKTYAFKPEGAGGEVRFEVTRAEQEKDNVKGAKRYFVPESKAQDGAAAVFRFEYRPLTEAETKKHDTKGGKTKSNGAENGNGENGNGQLAASKVQDQLLRAWLDGNDFKSAAVPAALRGAAFDKHVARYVRRQTSDFFVHPHLGPFLEGELDYFLKNEFLQLWDRETPEALARERAKFNIVREIGRRIIAFLHQIEDFRARLFEKRKFILRTDWMVMASALAARVGGKTLVDQAAANKQQVAEWRRWVGDDKLAGKALLAKYPHLPIHTVHFDEAFALAMLGCFHDIDAELGGVLVHGENYAALRTLEPRFRDAVQCIYIDPPYNTGSDNFLYKDDTTRHSAWATLMYTRVSLATSVLTQSGVLFSSIDHNERHSFDLLLRLIFDDSNRVGEIVWKNVTDNNPTNIANEHEYIECFTRNAMEIGAEWKSNVSGIKTQLIELGDRLIREQRDPDELNSVYQNWYRENRAFLGPMDGYKYIDSEGIYCGSRSVHNPGKEGYRYDVVHPVTKKPCKQPLMGYRFPEETMRKLIAEDRIIYGDDETKLIEIKLYAHEFADKLSSVIDLDGRSGPNELRALFRNEQSFKNPKPVALLKELLPFVSRDSDQVLDFFAGSGTTAHAVICLNREDKGKRRFVLVDQEEHFDTVILPRLAKVLTSPEWKDGSPKPEVNHTADSDDHWSRRTLPLVRIQRIERYEDSLDALENRGEYDARRAGMQEMAGADYTLRYLLEEETRGSALFAPGRLFEAPFSAQLPVHTPGGVKLVAIDLAESTLAMLGLRLTRVFEDRFEKRRYRIMAARTRTEEIQLVVLRDLTPDPEKKFWEREYRWLAKLTESRWGVKLGGYARIWHNGDTLFLDGEPGASIDAEFARVMQERDPHAAAG